MKKDMIRVAIVDGKVVIEILDIGFNVIYRGAMNLDEYARCTISGGSQYCAIERDKVEAVR